MASVTSLDPTPRTNSLAFAKVDCHTCIRLNNRCDRRRPKCGTCLSQGHSCGGFAQDLVWKQIPQGDVRQSDQSRSRRSQGTTTTRGTKVFKIVEGRPQKRRRVKPPSGSARTPFTGQIDFSRNTSIPPTASTKRRQSFCYSQTETSTPSSSSGSTIDDNGLPGTYDADPLSGVDGRHEARYLDNDNGLSDGSHQQLESFEPVDLSDLYLHSGRYHDVECMPTEDATPVTDLSVALDLDCGGPCLDLMPLTSPILFESLAEKYSPLLSMCESSSIQSYIELV